jgi:hypothetical protein
MKYTPLLFLFITLAGFVVSATAQTVGDSFDYVKKNTEPGEFTFMDKGGSMYVTEDKQKTVWTYFFDDAFTCVGIALYPENDKIYDDYTHF